MFLTCVLDVYVIVEFFLNIFNRVINLSLAIQACAGPYQEYIGPRSSVYGPRCGRSALSTLGADIM